MCNPGVTALLAVVLTVLLAAPVASQEHGLPLAAPPPVPTFPVSLLPPTLGLAADPPALSYVIAGGAIAGALGAVASTAYGAEFDFRYPAAGAALAIPVGVHLANRRRGSLLLGGLASAAIGTAFILGSGDGPHTLLVSAPIALVVSVAVERLTGQR